MTIVIILLALAAVGGLAMAIMVFRKRALPPLGLALVHGVAAASGLAVLIGVIASDDTPASATVGLTILLGAALAGFALFAHHLKQKALPPAGIVIHAVLAVAGFLTLLAGSFF